MKNLKIGKALLLLLLPFILHASVVSARLDKPIVYKGDSVTLTLDAKGDNVEFPTIDKISGFRVLGTSTSQSIQAINGKVSKTISKSYTFVPSKSIKIPSFTIRVDGKSYKTKPIELKLKAPSSAPKDESVQLIIKSDKKEAYVGENIRVDLIFKRSIDSNFDKVEIAPIKLEHFWSKNLTQSKPYSCGDFICQKYSYILTPQQEGNYTIPSTFARLGKYDESSHHNGMFNDPFFDDPFFNSLRGRLSWKKIYSNPLHIKIKALPDDAQIYGDFSIEAKVDKKEVQANKPLHLTLTIKGSGNIEDIDKFNINIPDAIVYADEPTIDTHIEGDKSVGEFREKIAIVADHNYTIPSLSLKYYDSSDKKIKTIQTKPIPIKVIGGALKRKEINNQPTLEEKIVDDADNNKTVMHTSKKSAYEKSYLILAFLTGILTTLAFFFLRNLITSKKSSKKTLSIIDEIEKTKDDKKLFSLLLPYANKSDIIKEELDKLEKNIYKNDHKLKIDKDRILDEIDEIEGV